MQNQGNLKGYYTMLKARTGSPPPGSSGGQVIATSPPASSGGIAAYVNGTGENSLAGSSYTSPSPLMAPITSSSASAPSLELQQKLAEAERKLKERDAEVEQMKAQLVEKEAEWRKKEVCWAFLC